MVFSLLLSGAITTRAQSYCNPTFDFGCFSWRLLEVGVGDINWELGANDCTLSDYTSLSTVMVPGEPYDMTVSSGVWCGAAVWVDLNNDYEFTTDENLFYIYTGGDPSYDYSFQITLPGGTAPGSYRMRVIGAWGSDGFSDTNTNGYGPCGAFQYGNFADFAIVVEESGQGIFDSASTQPDLMSVYPNPTTSLVTVNTSVIINAQIFLSDITGKTVLQTTALSAQTSLDLSALEAGVYFLTCTDGLREQTIKIVK